MVSNPFTTKQIKGVFGNISKFMQTKKEAKKEEKRLDTLQAKQEHKDNTKYYNQDYVNEAREYQKEKARQVIDSNVPLSHKLKAINELHKDHRQPKINPTIQELSDRAYVNRYKKDMRMERVKMIQKAILDDRAYKNNERAVKMEAIQNRNRMLKMDSKVNQIINQIKQQLRRR